MMNMTIKGRGQKDLFAEIEAVSGKYPEVDRENSTSDSIIVVIHAHYHDADGSAHECRSTGKSAAEAAEKLLEMVQQYDDRILDGTFCDPVVCGPPRDTDPE